MPTTADTIALTANGADDRGIYQDSMGIMPAGTYTLSVYAKLLSGNGQFVLGWYCENSGSVTNAGTSATLTATTTWARFSVTFSLSSGNTYNNFAAYKTALQSAAGTIAMFGMQLEVAASASTYQATTGSAGATNKILYSEQFDNAAWTKFGATATVTADTTDSPLGDSTLAPGADSLAYTGYAPTISAGSTLGPAKGSLTYTGYAPSMGFASGLSPGADSLSYTGYIPTLSSTREAGLTPGGGALRYTGYAPSIGGLPREIERVPVVNSLEQARRTLNPILEYVQSMLPGYGTALPEVADQPDGRLFVRMDLQTLYQVQNGAWVAVDMVP